MMKMLVDDDVEDDFDDYDQDDIIENDDNILILRISCRKMMINNHVDNARLSR